jgi:hypothetical protein
MKRNGKVHEDEIVPIPITKQHRQRCWEHAKLARIGGKSQIVHDKQERKSKLSEHQLAGQVGELALSLYMTGDIEAYEEQRAAANANPTEGDKGIDLPGCNLDVKGSVIRTSLPLLEHHLWVREREYHDDWVYILCLIDKEFTVAQLIGWCPSKFLEREYRPNRFNKDADKLWPLMPTRHTFI